MYPIQICIRFHGGTVFPTGRVSVMYNAGKFNYHLLIRTRYVCYVCRLYVVVWCKPILERCISPGQCIQYCLFDYRVCSYYFTTIICIPCFNAKLCIHAYPTDVLYSLWGILHDKVCPSTTGIEAIVICAHTNWG